MLETVILKNAKLFTISRILRYTHRQMVQTTSDFFVCCHLDVSPIRDQRTDCFLLGLWRHLQRTRTVGDTGDPAEICDTTAVLDTSDTCDTGSDDEMGKSTALARLMAHE